MSGWRLLSSSRAGWSSNLQFPIPFSSGILIKVPLRVTLVLSAIDDDWFDGARVKELYLISVVVVLADRLAVANEGCKVVGVMIITSRVITIRIGLILRK